METSISQRHLPGMFIPKMSEAPHPLSAKLPIPMSGDLVEVSLPRKRDADSVSDTAALDLGAWATVAVAIAFQVVIYGGIISTFSFWISGWSGSFGMPRGMIMILSTEVLVISAFIAPFSGHFIDRWSARGVVCVGLAAFACGWMLLSFSHQFWQAQVAYGLGMGLALALAGPSVAQTITAKRFAIHRGLALGIVVVGSSLAGVICAPVLVWLLGHFNWRTLARMIAMVGIALIPLVALVVRLPAARKLGSTHGGVEPLSLETSEWTTKAILLEANFWILILVFLPTYLASMAYIANFGPILADRGAAPQHAAFTFSLLCVAAMCGKPIVGRLTDYWDPRLVLIGGFVIMDTGFLMMLGSPSPARIAVANLFIGVGVATFFPLQGVMLSRYFGTSSFGRVMGMMSFFLLLIGAVGGPLAGMSRDAFGSYDRVLLSFGTIPLLTSLSVLILKAKSLQVVGRSDSGQSRGN